MILWSQIATGIDQGPLSAYLFSLQVFLIKMVNWIQSSLLAAFAVALTRADNALPSEEFTSSDGKLEVTLEVDLVTSLNGTRNGPGYNGFPVGPTLRVKPGDTISLTLKNNLSPGSAVDRSLYEYVSDPESFIKNYTNLTIVSDRLSAVGNPSAPVYGFWGLQYMNIHFHGAEFTPTAENTMMAIDGGESHTYEFKVNENKSGLVWYHNHMHGTSSYSMLSGLYGFMVIEGPEDVTQLDELQGAKEQFLIMGESLVDPETGSPAPEFPIVMAFKWDHVTNGENGRNKTFEYDQGDLVLFRAASASVEPTMNLTLDNHTFTILSRDGFILPEPETVDYLIIGAGQRVEFVVKFDQPGTFTWRRAAWNSGVTGLAMCTAAFNIPQERCVSYDINKVAAIVKVAESTQASSATIPESLPEMPAYLMERASRPTVGNRTVTLVMKSGFPLFQIPYNGPFVPPGVGMGINSLFFVPHDSHGDLVAGSCEKWTIGIDPPQSEHVFHAHSVPFMVTQHNGADIESPYWTDTVLMNMMLTNITAHICFDGLSPGEMFMVHCHMPTHQDIGVRNLLCGL
jgi:FtsP/CotA-like multicopper oxidase with cupredoxin domain